MTRTERLLRLMRLLRQHRYPVSGATLAAEPAPILPLLSRLELTAGKTDWGYAFRFGLLAISAHDMAVIVAAMRASALAPD